jgi:hypothetical protein
MLLVHCLLGDAEWYGNLGPRPAEVSGSVYLERFELFDQVAQ